MNNLCFKEPVNLQNINVEEKAARTELVAGYVKEEELIIKDNNYSSDKHSSIGGLNFSAPQIYSFT